MKKRTLAFYSVCALLVCLQPLTALDRQIVLGREDRWQDVASLDNLVLIPGRWGSLDLVLRQAEYQADAQTDLLIHFNTPADAMGHYRPVQENVLLCEKVSALGGASAGFNSGKTGLKLAPAEDGTQRRQPGALFSRGSWLQDFSIEFWLYPALLSDGEEIFAWRGARWNGKIVLPQEIRCTVQDRRLDWQLVNFFTGSTGGSLRFGFRGLTPLVPKEWNHHLLRYDSRLGMLEYLVNAVPEAILFTTDSGREAGELLLPFVGDAGPGSIAIGADYTGFIDELRISRAMVDSPSLSRYGGHTGTALSRTFDLGYTGTRIKRIDAVYSTPGDSDVYFYYRASDRADADLSTLPWIQFHPGQPLAGSRGRYLQVMVELFPDGGRRHSAQLSELRIVYEQDLPPAPPTGLYSAAGNGKVRLYWNTVNEEDVKGYLIYYGYAPANYHGKDSDQGSSPVDVGRLSDFELTGLTNGKLYYFAVVAYDATDPPHRSLFSKEVSARPSGLLP